MSALKGSVTLHIGKKKVHFRSSQFDAPEGWGWWRAENDDFIVEVKAQRERAHVDAFSNRSFHTLDIDWFPRKVGDINVEMAGDIRLPYNRNAEEDEFDLED